MAEQKKKRQSIADMKRELQAMQIASRRRQQGKKATGESVAKELKIAGSGQSTKASDKSKYVSPGGKEYAGPGYSAGQPPKPKPKPKPAAQPVKPSSVKPQVAEPQSGPKGGDAPAKPADPTPAKGKKTLPPGAPDPKDPKYNGTEGFKRYINDRKAWERSQTEGKRPTRRSGESAASYNRRLQAYLRRNR